MRQCPRRIQTHLHPADHSCISAGTKAKDNDGDQAKVDLHRSDRPVRISLMAGFATKNPAVADGAGGGYSLKLMCLLNELNNQRAIKKFGDIFQLDLQLGSKIIISIHAKYAVHKVDLTRS